MDVIARFTFYLTLHPTLYISPWQPFLLSLEVPPMRFALVATLVSVLFSSLPQETQNVPRRDPQAVAVLQQSFAVMGGAAPNDSVLTGTADIVAGSKQGRGRIRILSRGLDQFIEELDTEDGQRVFVHSQGRAEVRERFERKKLPLEQALSTQPPTAPNVVIAAALLSADTNYSYRGIEELDGVRFHRIRFWNSFASRKPLSNLAEFTERDIWIDAATGLPAKLAFEQRAGGGAADRMDVAITYSDYRPAGGFLVPFRIEIARNGVTWKTITIEQVQWNVGLTAVDFSIR